MLVSDVNERIYSYDLASKERQDSNALSSDFVLYQAGSSGPKIIPYGFWLDPEITVELYAYKAWWVTNNVGSGVSIEKRYLMGTRFSVEDITLENLIAHSTRAKVPELNTVGNLVVFEVADDVTTTDKFQYDYDLDEKKYYMISSAGNWLVYDGQGYLMSTNAARETIKDENNTPTIFEASTNMVQRTNRKPFPNRSLVRRYNHVGG